MGTGGDVTNVKKKLLSILEREIRPHLRDSHPDRRERYRRCEAVVVDLVKRPAGTEIEGLWSQIEELSHIEPWGSGLRLSLKFRGRPTYPITREPSGGQLGWDFSSRIDCEETVDSHGSTREAHLRILRNLLKTPPAEEPEAVRQQRSRLMFLIDLYETLRDEA